MAGAVLTAADRAHFMAMMRRQTNSAVHRRMNPLLLLDDGWTTERVAERFGLAYTPLAMARLLCRIGFVWKRPKVVPAKADAAAQRSFLEGTLRPLMATAEADPAQTLLFVNATHPAYDAHPAAGWVRRGATVTLKSNLPVNTASLATLHFALGGMWPELHLRRELLTGFSSRRHPALNLTTPRQALLEFRETYNAKWLIQRHGFRPPAAIRQDQLPPAALAA